MMKRFICYSLITLFGLIGNSLTKAATLECVGIVGNSGEQGKTLIHATLGRGGGGVVVDENGRIFTAGGDRILVLDANGKFLWDLPLPSFPERPEFNYFLSGPSFASADDTLYFTAGPALPYADNRTFADPPYNYLRSDVMQIEMVKDAQPEIVVPFALNDPLDEEFCLTSNPYSNRVYLGLRTKTSAATSYTVSSTKNSR